MKITKFYLQLQAAIENAPTIPPCQTTDPEVWFDNKDDGHMNYNVAKRFCNQCPVINECAKYALEAEEPFGVWGGLSARERDKMIGARNRIRKQSERLA